MNYKIQEIEGIGPAYAQKLSEAGIETTGAMLKLCCHKKGRKETADKTGLSETQLLRWANLADLMRVSGIGAEYSELLEAAGVDTVKELRTRNAENLSGKMAEVNSQKKLTRTVPSVKMVAKWVSRAATLDPVITH